MKCSSCKLLTYLELMADGPSQKLSSPVTMNRDSTFPEGLKPFFTLSGILIMNELRSLAEGFSIFADFIKLTWIVKVLLIQSRLLTEAFLMFAALLKPFSSVEFMVLNEAVVLAKEFSTFTALISPFSFQCELSGDE